MTSVTRDPTNWRYIDTWPRGARHALLPAALVGGYVLYVAGWAALAALNTRLQLDVIPPLDTDVWVRRPLQAAAALAGYLAVVALLAWHDRRGNLERAVREWRRARSVEDVEDEPELEPETDPEPAPPAIEYRYWETPIIPPELALAGWCIEHADYPLTADEHLAAMRDDTEGWAELPNPPKDGPALGTLLSGKYGWKAEQGRYDERPTRESVKARDVAGYRAAVERCPKKKWRTPVTTVDSATTPGP